MAVADHIADLADIVDLAKTVKANFDSTYAGILSSQLGAPDGDEDAELKFLADNQLQGLRRHFAALLSNLQEGAEAVLRSLAKTLDRSDVTFNSTMSRILQIGLREEMISTSKVLESRAVTHNAASSVSGSGDGILLMHTLDDQSSPEKLEAVNAGILTFECIQDQSDGLAAGGERFRVKDNAPAIDIIDLGGQPGTTILIAQDFRASLLNNSGFEQSFNGTGTDKIRSWTAENPANIAASTVAAQQWRGSQSLEVTGVMKLTQAMSFNLANRPHLFQVIFNRQIGSASVTLVARMGAKSTTVVIAAQTGFNRLQVVAWPDEFAGGGFDVEIEVTVYNSGTLYIDDVTLTPLTRIGGRYFVILPGQTDFVRNDSFTQNTTIAATGLIKDWLHRWFGLNHELPHNPTASGGWEDPA